jgi:hypothetical protein
MTSQPELFWGMIASMWVGNLMLVLLNLPLVGMWVKLLSVRYSILYPAILLFSVIGVYSLNSSVLEVFLAAAFGLFGYLLLRLGCEPAPLLLGLVLGPLLEEPCCTAPRLSMSFSISLHLLAGANDPSNNSYVTGYLGQGGVPASYIFQGLQVPGFTITGVSATHLGGVFDSGVQVQLIGGAQLHFRLDSLLFDTAQNLRDGNGYYYADFRLDLSTQPVPEPAVWALSLLGLAALQLVTHRRRA